ncbi:MAG: hypothetical protein WBE72_05985 [Terracidiphilus sp.]
MAILVVSGSARNVGKTSLVCGLIAALPEFSWTAVKITSHDHGRPEPLWEETEAGQGTDTARYLAAGAHRAFLIAAGEADLPRHLAALWQTLGHGAHAIFESNRILGHLRPDLCLAVEPGIDAVKKHSYGLVERQKGATVRPAVFDRAEHNPGPTCAPPVFYLAAFERIPPQMRDWIREQLGARAGN